MGKREVFDQLGRDVLLGLVERFELEVEDRRRRELLVEALAGSRKVDLGDALGGLSRDSLKAICRGLGLDDSGKEKSAIIERVVTAVSGPAQKAWATRRASGSNGNGRGAARSEPEQVVLPGVAGKLSREQLERYLWSAADILRGSIDSSDYKGYIFGLLFLKRLSDRFDEECEALRAEGHDADDPDEHEFFVPKRARWSEIQRTATNLGETLNKACAALEDQNGVALEGVLAGIDFNDEPKTMPLAGDMRRLDGRFDREVARGRRDARQRLVVRLAAIREPIDDVVISSALRAVKWNRHWAVDSASHDPLLPRGSRVSGADVLGRLRPVGSGSAPICPALERAALRVLAVRVALAEHRPPSGRDERRVAPRRRSRRCLGVWRALRPFWSPLSAPWRCDGPSLSCWSSWMPAAFPRSSCSPWRS